MLHVPCLGFKSLMKNKALIVFRAETVSVLLLLLHHANKLIYEINVIF